MTQQLENPPVQITIEETRPNGITSENSYNTLHDILSSVGNITFHPGEFTSIPGKGMGASVIIKDFKGLPILTIVSVPVKKAVSISSSREELEMPVMNHLMVNRDLQTLVTASPHPSSSFLHPKLTLSTGQGPGTLGQIDFPQLMSCRTNYKATVEGAASSCVKVKGWTRNICGCFCCCLPGRIRFLFQPNDPTGEMFENELQEPQIIFPVDLSTNVKVFIIFIGWHIFLCNFSKTVGCCRFGSRGACQFHFLWISIVVVVFVLLLWSVKHYS